MKFEYSTNTAQGQRFNTHVLIVDPIPFQGGSKLASQAALSQCHPDTQLTILTVSPSCWQRFIDQTDNKHRIESFNLPAKICSATGIKFWIKQLYTLLAIVRCCFKYRPIDSILGISGPGVDMAIYLYGLLSSTPVKQLIHGPVATSYSIGAALAYADSIFYLPTTLPSVKQALQHFYKRRFSSDLAINLTRLRVRSPYVMAFENGLSRQQWPQKISEDARGIFWAASLLKWKGLDRLLAVVQQCNEAHLNYPFHICYIRPQAIELPVTQAPIAIDNVHWYEAPSDLDRVRSRNNIFVSTSIKEPFGLSILEALAAGLCVLIPADGAYWDQVLTDQLDCCKYQADDADNLFAVLKKCIEEPQRCQQIGLAGQQIAQHYVAEACYAQIAQSVDDNGSLSSSCVQEDL